MRDIVFSVIESIISLLSFILVILLQYGFSITICYGFLMITCIINLILNIYSYIDKKKTFKQFDTEFKRLFEETENNDEEE